MKPASGLPRLAAAVMEVAVDTAAEVDAAAVVGADTEEGAVVDMEVAEEEAVMAEEAAEDVAETAEEIGAETGINPGWNWFPGHNRRRTTEKCSAALLCAKKAFSL
jgi:hypothetical protein